MSRSHIPVAVPQHDVNMIPRMEDVIIAENEISANAPSFNPSLSSSTQEVNFVQQRGAKAEERIFETEIELSRINSEQETFSQKVSKSVDELKKTLDNNTAAKTAKRVTKKRKGFINTGCGCSLFTTLSFVMFIYLLSGAISNISPNISTIMCTSSNSTLTEVVLGPYAMDSSCAIYNWLSITVNFVLIFILSGMLLQFVLEVVYFVLATLCKVLKICCAGDCESPQPTRRPSRHPRHP